MIYNYKRVFISLAYDNLQGFKKLCLGRVLCDFLLNNLLDIFSQPWQIPALCIRVTTWIQRLGQKKPGGYPDELTEDDIMSALNGSKDFVMGHLAGEVHIGFHTQEQRTTGACADGYCAHHGALPLGLGVCDLD